MMAAITMSDGSVRAVNDAGQIGTLNVAPSDAWLFLGVAGAWNARSPTWTWDAIRRYPEEFARWSKGRKLYGFDRDHGHTRKWCSPSIRRVELSP